MDDFERELREMLNDRIATVPTAFDAPPVLLQRARRRRTTKLTALAASVVVVIGGAAGTIAQIAGDDGPRRVITTAPTSTLARPGVRTVACAQDYPDNIRGTRVLPPTRPRVPTAGDPAILPTLVWFAESVVQNVIVLGPSSWACHFPVGDGLVVYDPVATGGAVPTVDDAPILVENGYPWVDPAGARIACSVFDDAVVMEHVNRSDTGDCVHDRTPRRIVTRVDEHLATFVDDDGSRGVAWLQLPSSNTASDGSVSVLRCRPTEGLTAAACDTIVAEYSARLSEARVQNVGCPSTTDGAEGRPSSSPAPTIEPAVPTAATAGHPPTLQYFGGWGADPRYVVLGPDSWSCLQRSTEHGSSTVVYDPNATPGRVPGVDAATIALQNEVWEGPSGARLLCSVFDDSAAVEFARRNYPGSCLTAPAPTRSVTRVSGNFATFVDANGDRGAGWMIPPSPDTQEPGRIAVLTCRPSAELTIATCDAIVADYARWLNDGSPPPASTTTATTGEPATVATIACPISYAVAGQKVDPPSTEPRVSAGGDSARLSHLASYAVTDDPRYVALGPASWSCAGLMAADGDNAMVVYRTAGPGGAVPDIFTAPIAIENDFLWHGGVGSGAACSVFDDAAVVQYMTANFPQELPCPRAGRTVTRIDSHASRFVDADGARGAGWIVLPSSPAVDDGRISVLTCRPTDGLTTADCDTIIADWIARNDETG